MELKPVWKEIRSDDGSLVYEGFTLCDKPYGAGTTFFSTGIIYQEGVFGIKGLLCGREYYPNGKLRFEGAFELCKGYGPNYPKYGKCFDNEGKVYYAGEIKLHFGGVGYPVVESPEQYGPIAQENRPKVAFFIWDDARQLGIPSDPFSR